MIAVDAWNRLIERVRRARPLRGVRCATSPRPDGVIVSGETGSPWRHPWFVTPRYEFKDDGSGEWRGFIKPGFVNGRDAHITMPKDWPEKGDEARDVPLTDDTPPYLVLDGWHNPIVSAGVGASDAGELVYSPGTGYPPFFADLGVRPPAAGGKDGDAPFDPDRTRELRSMDMVLAQPRLGTRLDIGTPDPLTDGQSESVSTLFVNDYFRATGGRAKLRATARWQPPEEQSLHLSLGLLLRADDPQVDEIKIATLWVVSPPDTPDDAEPDQTWTPYPQHFAFWNLTYATRLIPPAAPSQPIRLQTGLPLADFIGNALLSFTNDQFAEMQAFFGQADNRGIFWNT